MWIISTQLGRRNLTDFQRNEIALKYEAVIAARMRERMSDMGKVGAEMTNNGGGSNEHTPIIPTTKRKELLRQMAEKLIKKRGRAK